MSKSIDDLIPDIYKLFADGHECHPERVEAFGANLAQTVADRLKSYSTPREGYLRLSNLGKGDRQLWYEVRPPDPTDSTLEPHTKMMFLLGDIWESLLLLLAKEAGHDVSNEQAEVVLAGIKGHKDADIDGVVVDVKSASSYSFKKFKFGELAENDPFGYMEQMAGYSKTSGDKNGAFLAVDKQTAKLALLKVPAEDLQALEIETRAEHMKEVVASPEPPARCHDPAPFGQSGNEVLGVNCSYCAFKRRCWSDANDGLGLRTFIYSDGPKYFTKIVTEPRVSEVWS